MSKVYKPFYIHNNFKEDNQKHNKLTIQKPKLKSFCTRVFKTNMDISVIYEDETEAEFELDFCCVGCAKEQCGWTHDQYLKAYNRSISNEPIKIPSNIKTLTQFKNYLIR